MILTQLPRDGALLRVKTWGKRLGKDGMLRSDGPHVP